MPSMTTVKDALYRLDQMAHEPNDFEANVLETVTRQVLRGRLPTEKQCAVLCKMIEHYLDDPTLLRDMQEE